MEHPIAFAGIVLQKRNIPDAAIPAAAFFPNIQTVLCYNNWEISF